jgi:hypothetical protein
VTDYLLWAFYSISIEKMTDFQTFDDTFFLTLAGLLVSVCGLSIRYCYRSKCKTIDMCGIHIVRDVDAEVELDEQENKNDEEV